MQRFLKIGVTISALSTLIAAPILSAGAASAQPTGTDASYIGAGIAGGVTNGGRAGEGAKFGGNIQGRLAIPKTPLSVRGSVLFTDKADAIIPQISYDVPVTNNANVYLGAGYSFVDKHGNSTSSPIGNKNAPVLTAGVEAQVSKNILLYSDAKLGINAYRNSPASAVSLQAGVAYRF